CDDTDALGALMDHALVCVRASASRLVFFHNADAPTLIYPLSLHDALPISFSRERDDPGRRDAGAGGHRASEISWFQGTLEEAFRSEEHTSELQSLRQLVCRLLLEKKKRTARLRSSRPRTSDPRLDAQCFAR